MVLTGHKRVADICCGLLPILLGLQLFAWIVLLRGALAGHADFRAFYSAGILVRTGHGSQLYDYAAEKRVQDAHINPQEIGLPFNHLSYEALLFAPFTYFSYSRAWLAFLLFNACLLAVSLRLLWPYLSKLGWALIALALTFLPISVVFIQGQDSVLLLLVLCAVYVSLEKQRDFAAGVLLALGLFKFQIVLPIAALFFLWKRWKVVRGFALSAAVVLAVSFAVVGWSGMKLYPASILPTAAQSTQIIYGINPSMMPNLRGLAFGLGFPVWLVALASIILLLAASQVKPSLEIAICIAALASYHFLIHDMSILLIPALLALNAGRWQGWLLMLAPVLMLYPPLFCLAALALLAFLLPPVNGMLQFRRETGLWSDPLS